MAERGTKMVELMCCDVICCAFCGEEISYSGAEKNE